MRKRIFESTFAKFTPGNRAGTTAVFNNRGVVHPTAIDREWIAADVLCQRRYETVRKLWPPVVRDFRSNNPSRVR